MNNQPTHKSMALAAITGLAIFVLAGLAHADTYTFIGGGTTTDWSDTSNWAGGIVPTNDGTADIILSGSSPATSTVDVAWEVNSITQASGADYTLNSLSGAHLQVNSSFDNSSTSTLTLSATIANTDTSVNYYGLTFNSGSYYVTSSAMTYANFAVNPSASVIVSSSGSASSTYGVISVGETSGTIGGSGTFTSNDFIVRAPDGSPTFGPTLIVGDPNVNGGVGTLTINAPSVDIVSSGGDTLKFAFGSGSHSLLQTTGNLNLTVSNTFTISSTDGTTAPGLYTLISYNGAAIDSGTLATEILNLPSGWQGSLVSSANTLSLDLTQAVPEPQTWVLMGLGLVGLLVIVRRKNTGSCTR